MHLAVIVSFLDEENYLPTLLESIAAQTRPPDQLILVDDGSTDSSYDLAQRFAAEHAYARAVRRPPRAAEADRLATAAELRSFAWARDLVEEPWDVLVKMDADLRLSPEHFETVMRQFDANPKLGIGGCYLAIEAADGAVLRETHPPHHVRGANKFYRRACLRDIGDVPPILGWDMIDEVSARLEGWETASFELPAGDSIHLRPTGAHGGSLRAYRRWGECAWGYGAHPIFVLLGGVLRLTARPYVLGGVNYAYGWARAGVRRRGRAGKRVRAFVRREEFAELRRLVTRGQRHPRLQRASV